MHPDAFKLFNGEYPTVNAHIDGNVRTIKFEKNPQTGHVEAVIPDDVHKLLDEIDAREIPAFQQRLDRVLPIMRNEIGDGISFGDGSSLKMINDLPVIQTPDGLVNFDMAGIRGYLFSNPDLFKRLSNIHATWSKVRHPDYHEYYGPFQLNQPRAAFVSFEKGGILSKLNPKHKQFLNIK